MKFIRIALHAALAITGMNAAPTVITPRQSCYDYLLIDTRGTGELQDTSVVVHTRI
jgi:hypothetical protein